jgi:hypothetical protein
VTKSEFVQFLSSLQTGMMLWIIDEDTLLSDDQHRDLVSLVLASVYRNMNAYFIIDCCYLLCISGQIGSPGSHPQCHFTVYPISFCPSSRTCASSLSFPKFWRATYHSRLDIPKKDYPLLIQTCIKVWADFCEDDFADGISLDSL